MRTKGCEEVCEERTALVCCGHLACEYAMIGGYTLDLLVRVEVLCKCGGVYGRLARLRGLFTA